MSLTEQNVRSLAPERRRFGRLKVSEPRICRIHPPQSQELWTDRGILMNISLGGIYFVCNRKPPLEKNDILYVTFDSPSSDSDNHHLGFHVLVVRTEQRQLEVPQFAVAVRILSSPIYYPLPGADKRESGSLDKARLMYQYYDLNRKTYELITKTPDVRTDKIKSLRRYIETDSYEVLSEKVTRRVIDDLFLENLLVQKK